MYYGRNIGRIGAFWFGQAGEHGGVRGAEENGGRGSSCQAEDTDSAGAGFSF